MTKPNEFMECTNCRSIAGSPYLCTSCLHNRQAILNLVKGDKVLDLGLILFGFWIGFWIGVGFHDFLTYS